VTTEGQDFVRQILTNGKRQDSPQNRASPLPFSMESSKISSPAFFLVSYNIHVSQTFRVFPMAVFVHPTILLLNVSAGLLKKCKTTTGKELHPSFLSDSIDSLFLSSLPKSSLYGMQMKVKEQAYLSLGC